MSRVADLLARKRAAEIKRMETGAEVPTDAVDAALRSVKPPKTPKPAHPMSARLVFTAHARRRMAQRGMAAADVYAIYMGGEPRQSGGELAIHVTEQAVEDAPERLRSRLDRWRGCAIIVRPGDGERPPALVTVLADGGDTVFLGKRG